MMSYARKRPSEEPIPEPSQRRWIDAEVGSRELTESGHRFSVSYHVKNKMPYVTLESNPPPVANKHPVNLETSEFRQVMVSSITMPLRIVLDLLHVQLTHNREKYLHGYKEFPTPERPKDYAMRGPWPGCFHTVTVDPESDTPGLLLVPQAQLGNESPQPRIPEVKPIHLRYSPNTPKLTCTLARYPAGTLLFAMNNWVKEETYFGKESEFKEVVFPLCNVEQLPALIAILHQWLNSEEYMTRSLMINFKMYPGRPLVPTPKVNLDFKYNNTSTQVLWPNSNYVNLMRRDVTYDNKPLRVEGDFGGDRRRVSMLECPCTENYHMLKAREEEWAREAAEEDALKLDQEKLRAAEEEFYKLEQEEEFRRALLAYDDNGDEIVAHRGGLKQQQRPRQIRLDPMVKQEPQYADPYNPGGGGAAARTSSSRSPMVKQEPQYDYEDDLILVLETRPPSRRTTIQPPESDDDDLILVDNPRVKRDPRDRPVKHEPTDRPVKHEPRDRPEPEEDFYFNNVGTQSEPPGFVKSEHGDWVPGFVKSEHDDRAAARPASRPASGGGDHRAAALATQSEPPGFVKSEHDDWVPGSRPPSGRGDQRAAALAQIRPLPNMRNGRPLMGPQHFIMMTNDIRTALEENKLRVKKVHLGYEKWFVRSSFTIRYDMTRGPRCLVFIGNNEGQGVSKGKVIQPHMECHAVTAFHDAVSVPVKMFWDVMAMALTHNTKYEAGYDLGSVYGEQSVCVMAPIPRSCTDKGCHHEFLYDPPEAISRSSPEMVAFRAVAREQSKLFTPHLSEMMQRREHINIPEPPQEHFDMTGVVETVYCAMTRQPRGPVFLTASPWKGTSEELQCDFMMMTALGEAVHSTFPLCHTDHLPGLAAAVQKWLQGDYRTSVLKVFCHTPVEVTLLQNPTAPAPRNEKKAGYRYTEKDVTKYWPGINSTENIQKMWKTVYDGTELEVEPMFGIVRPHMVRCPYARETRVPHVPRLKEMPPFKPK